MKRGVILGKFYPPHKGHKYLIETGQKNCDQLTIIVCSLSSQTIPGKLRVGWLKEIHPGVRVKLINYDGVDPWDSKLWARLTIKWLGFRPDIAFTSEDYGERWCKEMQCEHFLVDKARKRIPISGTKVREDPLASWEYLEPVVRAYFARRVAVVGAESTGTTTLAWDLAKRLKTVWVPEYGRIYYEGRMKSRYGNEWRSSEFVHIAKMQNQMEDELAKKSNKIVICDTNSFATRVWHRHYMGMYSVKVDRVAQGRKYELYVITNTDIPFVQDGTRDGKKLRQWMHEEFVRQVERMKQRYIVVSGSRKERVKQVLKVLKI